MDQPNEGYCITCCKQFKGTRGLAIHRRRMHPHAYHIEYSDTIVNNITSQSRQRWSEGVSRKLALIEIDILSKKSDSNRFPINMEIAEKFTERSLQAITTHRSSAKYKSLVRSLQTYVNINNIVQPVLHIDNLLTNNPNNDTEDTYDTDNITDTNSTNYDPNDTLPIHLDTPHLSDYIDNIQTNILHNNNIHINTINDTQPCETINYNVSNSYCYDLSIGPISQNNIDLTNKTNILQYILDLHPIGCFAIANTYYLVYNYIYRILISTIFKI